MALSPTLDFAYQPGAGLRGTPHDWSTDDAGATRTIRVLQWLDSNGNITTDNTGTPYCTSGSVGAGDCVQGDTTVTIGMCATCHTPHEGKSTSLVWNQSLSTSAFSWDQPTTTAGTVYPTFKGDTYKGPTTKCLSCHDGSVSSIDGIWFQRQYISGPGQAVGRNGNMSGNHPVAMPYPYGGALNTYNGTFNGPATNFVEFVPDPQASGIRLFNDAASNGAITEGAVAGKTGMECTSCHDLHNGSETKDQFLLRGMLSGNKAQGYICTKCHAR